MNDPIFSVMLLCIITIVALYHLVSQYLRARSPGSANSPLLLRELIPESLDTMVSASTQTPAGYYVTCYVSSLDEPTIDGDETAISAYAVNLPFTSGAHLIGFTRSIAYTPLSGQRFERVTLEGLYNETFDLFAAHNQQTQSRYILDPTAMVFTLDFCARYHWEILGDMLYFYGVDDNPDFAIIDEFIRQIRPAVEIASSRASDATQQPYTHVVHELLCPICSKTLTETDGHYSCPEGHGHLINGKQLIQMNNGELAPPRDAAVTTTHGPLTCPNCTATMNESEYQLTGVMINVCTKCRFRWCDAGELAKLF